MPESLPPLTDAQLQIMQVIWDRPAIAVSEVVEELARRGQRSVRNTVLTQMTRLKDKGWLRCEEGPRGFLYRAAHPRRETLTGMVSHLLDRAFAGSVDQLVMSLVRDRGLDEDEKRRLKAIIDEGVEG